MSNETIFVFVLIGVAAAMMASNRIRFDIIAILVVIGLMVSGVQTAGEALSGFGSPVVILVAALLVVGDMLERTGVAAAIGDWILKKGGKNETILICMIMVGAAVLGAVMSSTAIVAIFIPIVFRIAAETGLNSSRLFMPMSYAALISGMLTLIATTPNIVVSEELRSSGFDPFGFFSFSPVGLAALVVAILYMLLVGRRLLPANEAGEVKTLSRRSTAEIFNTFKGEREVAIVTIPADSELVGKSIEEANLEEGRGAYVSGMVRAGKLKRRVIQSVTPSTELRGGDSLVVFAVPAGVQALVEEGLMQMAEVNPGERKQWFWENGAATVMIHPESELIGKNLREICFRSRFGLHVLGMRRNGELVSEYSDVPFSPADSLFITGLWKDIQLIRDMNHDFVVMESPSEELEIVPSYKKMPVSLAILAGMVALSIFDVVPLVAAVIMAALLAVITRCMTMEDGYRAIHWNSIVLVAGMLPLADALESTGGTEIIVDGLMAAVGDSSPYLMMAALFFLTAVLGLFLSNTASAVLVAPIAITAAETLGVSPYAFATAVVIAASAAFVTPVSTPVVTLVVEPGRYRFVDFIRVGMPLLILIFLVTLLVAPMIFPFQVPS